MYLYFLRIMRGSDYFSREGGGGGDSSDIISKFTRGSSRHIFGNFTKKILRNLNFHKRGPDHPTPPPARSAHADLLHKCKILL